MIEKISKAALASKPFNLTEGMLSLNVIPSEYLEGIFISMFINGYSLLMFLFVFVNFLVVIIGCK